MKPFDLEQVQSPQDAIRRFHAQGNAGAAVAYIAGGTTVVDLLKLDAIRPDVLIDILPLRDQLSGIEVMPDGIRIGALPTMGMR